MKIALCTELRNAEWFESRLRSLFAGDGQLVIDELWNEKQLAPEVPLVWWTDDENFALIAYHLRISAFLSADCSDQELYEAIKPITKLRCEHANCAVQL